MIKKKKNTLPTPKGYFRFEILEKIVKDLIDQDKVELDYRQYSKIYLDFKSVVSVVYRYLLQNDVPYDERNISVDDVVTMAMTHVTKFVIDTVVDIDTRLTILYTFKPDKYRVSIEPTWELSRNKRINISGITTRTIKDTIISKLSLLSEKFPEKVKIVDIGGLPGSVIVNECIKQTPSSNRVLLISRDTTWLCILNYDNVEWFNGVDLYLGGKYYKDSISDKLKPIPMVSMLPIFFTVRGADRNEYKGVRGKGRIKTIMYMADKREDVQSALVYDKYQFLNDDFCDYLSPNHICLYDSVQLHNYINKNGDPIDIKTLESITHGGCF